MIEPIKHMTEFELAVQCMVTGDDLGEALCLNSLTAEQKERFSKIKDIYLEECLKDCPF
jgi:hypothetical protein